MLDPDETGRYELHVDIHCLQNTYIRFIVLTLTLLGANSAENKMAIVFLFLLDNRIWHFMQIVSLGDNMHDVSNPIF